MSKARRAALPQEPKNANEINAKMEEPYIQQNYGMTKRHEPTNGEPPASEPTLFFRTAFDCDEFSYCIFAAEDVISTIKDKTDSSQRTIFADGTFKICPVGQYKQVLIIFCDIYGHVST